MVEIFYMITDEHLEKAIELMPIELKRRLDDLIDNEEHIATLVLFE